MAKLTNYNLIKAASWYTIGNILIRGISFFVLPVFTSLMNTHDYGVFSVYTSYLSLFETLILFGLSSTVSLAKFTDDLNYESYMTTILFVPPLLSLLTGVGINLYLGSSGELLAMSPVLWNFMLVSSAAAAVLNISQARFVLEGKYRQHILYALLSTLGNVGLSLLLCYTIYRDHDVYMARVVGNCISMVITAFLVVLSQEHGRIRVTYVKTAMRWGVPLLFHTLATVVLTQTDRILIQYMDGYSSAGIYSIAVTITTIPLVLQSSIASAWTPWFYNELSQKNYSAIRKLNNKYIALFAVITAEIMLVSPEIIHIFTDQDYWDSIYSLIPLMICIFGEMLYSLPIAIEYYYKKTTFIMVGTMLTVVFNIVLDVVFIHYFGYIAAAYATTISKLVLFLLHYLFARKVDRNPIFQWRYVVVSLLLLCGLNILVITNVENLLLRFALFGSVGVAFVWYTWKNRNELLAMLRKQ